VIFDVDGTLVDSQAHIVGAMADAFDALRIPVPSRAEILGVVGLSLPLALARLAPALGARDLERLGAAYRESFMTRRDRAPVGEVAPFYPGMRALLDALSAQDDVLLGVATGKSRRGLERLVEAHGLGPLFVTTQTADDHPSKPNPAMILAALAETGVAPDRAVMVGDTTFDIEMARAAGVRGLGVAWGYHGADALERAGAEAVADTAEALAGLLHAAEWEG